MNLRHARGTFAAASTARLRKRLTRNRSASADPSVTGQKFGPNGPRRANTLPGSMEIETWSKEWFELKCFGTP